MTEAKKKRLHLSWKNCQETSSPFPPRAVHFEASEQFQYETSSPIHTTVIHWSVVFFKVLEQVCSVTLCSSNGSCNSSTPPTCRSSSRLKSQLCEFLTVPSSQRPLRNRLKGSEFSTLSLTSHDHVKKIAFYHIALLLQMQLIAQPMMHSKNMHIDTVSFCDQGRAAQHCSTVGGFDLIWLSTMCI